jgi:formate dehydrogenase major subunit
MTNSWIDIKNTDCCLIIGSNAAEHHPICFKWVLKAKTERGATIIHVDPKFSRTSARSDFHVPLRSGTDIAFMGGMINYVLTKEKYFKEYVELYTNASYIVNPKFSFNNGVFSGYNPKTRIYDKSSWAFEKDADGTVKRDPSLKNPRCVFQLLKKHYSRYTLDKVSSITGVSTANLLRVYEAYAATGTAKKAGTILYALGWTQHTTGVQNIRTSGIIQLLLGNAGIAGGGVNALRGEPNVQGTTDHAVLYNILPGYLPLPRANWQTLDEYKKATTPATKLPESINWWGNRPKYITSFLKAYFGDNATKENDFGYSWLPKGDMPTSERNGDYSFLYCYEKMQKGEMKGGSIWAHNPCQSIPNSNNIRKALTNLEFLYSAEIHHNETTDFWHGPGMNPKEIKTECFLFPSCHRLEKSGSVSSSQRMIHWHHQATDPKGDSKAMGQIMIEIMNRVRRLYEKEGGTFKEPIVNLNWYKKYKPEEVAKRINGWFTGGPKKGSQLTGFPDYKDDGTTASLMWLAAGSFTDEGNIMARTSLEQTAIQKITGIYPNYAWTWPMNRWILYNRASVDKNGQPWDPARPVIKWEDGKWIGDVADGGAPPIGMKGGKNPFIMLADGLGQLYGTGLVDGPFPEHYEPTETPVRNHGFSNQLTSPCSKINPTDKIAPPADPRYPIVLTTYSMTEHWCGGSETRMVGSLLEAEPQLYVEMSHELAKEKGIKNGDVVILESIRGRVEAVAMVTVRIVPFKIQGKTVHLVGMPFAFGWTKPGIGDATNRLTLYTGDPNTSIPEYKACCVNLRKADKVTELSLEAPKEGGHHE